MSILTTSIISAAKALPEGGLLSPKEFLHLASRAAVDQTFSRLAREGQLMRVGRGAYTHPVAGRFGIRPPSTETVIEAIESACGEVVVSHGAAEANALGLTTQVPTREVFLTSGPARKLHLGKRMIELKHGQRWQLALGKRPAGRVIRALSWLGPEQAAASLKLLGNQIPAEEWQALRASRSILPGWMARAVSEVMDHA
ncbi:DUF6088 family protein [Rhodoferax sp.]|uniref:DUF6088 family protein n=1 Tax=Rhodoferax sp. TaxID=50421 RepID=UPI00261D36E3|nr:DUF6088 family protein [Rhodoferax sp.]MDD2918507.1 DUF6088 family protein [Rhodoferax sp.]